MCVVKFLVFELQVTILASIFAVFVAFEQSFDGIRRDFNQLIEGSVFQMLADQVITKTCSRVGQINIAVCTFVHSLKDSVLILHHFLPRIYFLAEPRLCIFCENNLFLRGLCRWLEVRCRLYNVLTQIFSFNHRFTWINLKEVTFNIRIDVEFHFVVLNKLDDAFDVIFDQLSVDCRLIYVKHFIDALKNDVAMLINHVGL